MMVITMMILGTMTTYGKTNTESHNPYRTQTIKKECRLRHIHDKSCQRTATITKPCPVMDKKLQKHIIKGNHKYDRRGVCHKCHLTISEIHRYEHRMGLCRPTPRFGQHRR